MATAFVLGGTGQIGWAVCEHLAAAGWEVTAAARGTRESPPGIPTVRVDRGEPGALEAALPRDVDVLVDVIPYSARDADQLVALAGRVGSSVAVSSASVYADDRGRTLDEAVDLDSFPELPVPTPESHTTVEPGDSTYSAGKAAVERILLESAVPTTIVRPGAVHGPHASSLREWHFVKRALDGRRVVVLADSGRSRFHTTSVANLAELVLLAAAAPGDRVLNCGDPEPPSVLEIERAIADVIEHTWVEVLLPQDGYAVPAADTPWSAPRPFVLDMGAAERELRYRPVVRYEDAVHETVAWLVEETRRRDWREVLPNAARHLERSFDYAAEDEFLAGLASGSAVSEP